MAGPSIIQHSQASAQLQPVLQQPVCVSGMLKQQAITLWL